MVIVSVFSLKGGVGKTSVVLGLASSALAKGIPTLVVDLDPQADATIALDPQAEDIRDLASVLGAPTRAALDAAIAPSGWTDQAAGQGCGLLDLVVGSNRSATFEVPDPARRPQLQFRDHLRSLNPYQLVLMDCPPSGGGLTQTALRASDRALIVTEPGIFAVSASDRAIALIEDLRRDGASQLSPLGVVVNRVRARSTEQEFRLAELKSMFKTMLLNPQLPERVALQQAQGATRPIHTWPGPAAAELASDFDRLLARVLRPARA